MLFGGKMAFGRAISQVPNGDRISACEGGGRANYCKSMCRYKMRRRKRALVSHIPGLDNYRNAKWPRADSMQLLTRPWIMAQNAIFV